MIDSKSKLVLKILAKECSGGSYKIVEVADIIMAMPKYLRADSENVKHILTSLERQGMISIKYDDEDVFCIAVLPYGFEILEENSMKKQEKQAQNINFFNIFLCFFAALFGTVLGIVVCYFLIKLF